MGQTRMTEEREERRPHSLNEYREQQTNMSSPTEREVLIRVEKDNKQRSARLERLMLLSDTTCAPCLRPQVIFVLVIIAVFFVVWWDSILSIFVTNAISYNHGYLEEPVRFVHGQYAYGHKYILFWTGCFGMRNCGFTPGPSAYQQCPEKRCITTVNQNQLSTSDVVVFHVRDLNNAFHMDMPARHDPDQVWVYFTHESPYNTYLGNKLPLLDSVASVSHLDGMFNATMTYMRDSDFFVPYGSYSSREVPLKPSQMISAKNRTKLALWVVSNCSPQSFRNTYVAELGKHMSVDVYGHCGKPHPCPYSNATCSQQFTQKYKFYLAFENGQCRDYITEKFWQTLRLGVVPVVLGAWIEDYTTLAPPDSFIHVDNFTDPKHLAQFLQYLDKNDSAYDSYLSWREKFVVPGRQRPEEQLACQLCAAAHNKSMIPRKSYKVSSWYSPNKLCRDTRLNINK